MAGDLHLFLSSFPVSSPLLLSSLKACVTVGQLSQVYGMPKMELSPMSPLHQPLQSGAVDPSFFYLLAPRGSSLSLSAGVCGVFLPVFLFF